MGPYLRKLKKISDIHINYIIETKNIVIACFLSPILLINEIVAQIRPSLCQIYYIFITVTVGCFLALFFGVIGGTSLRNAVLNIISFNFSFLGIEHW